MRRNRVLILGLVLLALLLLVGPAFAQRDVANVELSDILDAIGPRDGQAILLDILLYLIFFVAFINQFLIPDKQLPVSLMNFAVMGIALFSKLLIDVQFDGGRFYPSALLEPGDFAVLPMNVAMMAFPLLMAGSLRAVKGKPPKAMFPSLIMGLLGGAYFFIFWATEQRILDRAPQAGDDAVNPEDLRNNAYFLVVVFSAGMLRTRWTLFKKRLGRFNLPLSRLNHNNDINVDN